MKILIDARMLYWTGVGRYTKELLTQLEKTDHQNEYVVVMRPEDAALWQPSAKNFTKLEIGGVNPYSVGEQLKLAWVLWRQRADLVHFTAPNAPVCYFGKRVTTIHDLTLLMHSTNRGGGLKGILHPLKQLIFRAVITLGAKMSVSIIAPTHYTKSQIVSKFNINPKRIQVIYEAGDEREVEPESVKRLEINTPYLFYVGNYYPYKNVPVCIDAFKQLAGKHPDLKLVLAGKLDTFGERLKVQAKNVGLANRIIFAGYVSDGELVSLYKGASVYLNPSLSEGFGLQGLESMYYGVPVVAANASCLPEVYGGGAKYFDPHDAAELAQQIDNLLSDEKVRHAQIRAGFDRVKQFSWAKTANDTLSVYKKVF